MGRLEASKDPAAVSTTDRDVRPFRQQRRIGLLWLLSPFVVAALAVTAPIWDRAGILPLGLRDLGAVAIFLGIAGRCWASMYVGGRKNRELVVSGPYRYTRNPLYLASSIAALGVGLLFGSLVLGLALFALSATVLFSVIGHEERTLVRLFGRDYENYRHRVPCLLPDWRSPGFARQSEAVMVSPAAMRRTFLDACTFLLAFPAAMLVDQLHVLGLVPVLLRLP